MRTAFEASGAIWEARLIKFYRISERGEIPEESGSLDHFGPGLPFFLPSGQIPGFVDFPAQIRDARANSVTGFQRNFGESGSTLSSITPAVGDNPGRNYESRGAPWRSEIPGLPVISQGRKRGRIGPR